ncbi:hypothetical protein [Allobaculum sp. Allo2]|uniref:hypothetical protein n=1 Tax=Allobaculum sp. Allo2 TaxID=2853432 RepID=UPI001F611670|nr:hypothetical protein [Allobaculum sp. Allo2]UNT93827.1 hypothetical protein KWG61_03655 [Allobaculum sp. Allo2]
MRAFEDEQLQTLIDVAGQKALEGVRFDLLSKTPPMNRYAACAMRVSMFIFTTASSRAV